MYRFSFKIRHKGCSETGLSIKFPKHHMTVIDIQSKKPKTKQYFYYIKGNPKDFDAILSFMKKAVGYDTVKEVERKEDTLLVLVILNQKSYVQNVIQKYNGFFLDLHTVHGGYEFWHVGVLDRSAIEPMRKEIKKLGPLKTLYIGEVEFAQTLLSAQQKKTFMSAIKEGYYESPRKTTIKKLSTQLSLHPATVGEHLMKAENKIMHTMSQRM